MQKRRGHSGRWHPDSRRAEAIVGPGKGSRIGIEKHTVMQAELEALQFLGISTEVSFRGRKLVRYGRIPVIEIRGDR